jgi:Putative Ig domain
MPLASMLESDSLNRILVVAMRSISLCLLSTLLVLGSCGGNGGDEKTLVVDFGFVPNYAYLWRTTSIDVTATGLEGNAPVCATVAGNPFQTGLSFANNSCRIVGVPTQATSGTVVVSLAVPGFQGQVQKGIVFAVLGPPIAYSAPSPLQTGTPLTLRPYSPGDVPLGTPDWTATAGETLSYSVLSGQLPPGLVLDPGTGVISGAATTAGDYRPTIGVTLQSSMQVFGGDSGVVTFEVR